MLKWFECPDGKQIEVATCLSFGGCRCEQRCFSLPTLRAVASDRAYKGVSPSMAGSDARLIWLKAITDYCIKPVSRAFALAGTNMHTKLALHAFNDECISEEKLSDKKLAGIPDVLEMDDQFYRETGEVAFILYDYKNYGSFKAARIAGIMVTKEQDPLTLPNGEPLLYKSGKNKDKQKFKTRKVITHDLNQSIQYVEARQMNRYRILFERHGFPISKIIAQIVVRDGGTYLAQDRGISQDMNMFLVPIERLKDNEVLKFYADLQEKVDQAFQLSWCPKCTDELSWNGRRCKDYCEVAGQCAQIPETLPAAKPEKKKKAPKKKVAK